MITIPSQPERQIVFEPDALRALAQAFEDTCDALQIFAANEHGRLVIATRIIDLASAGVTGPATLRDRVLTEARLAAARLAA